MWKKGLEGVESALQWTHDGKVRGEEIVHTISECHMELYTCMCNNMHIRGLHFADNANITREDPRCTPRDRVAGWIAGSHRDLWLVAATSLPPTRKRLSVKPLPYNSR